MYTLSQRFCLLCYNIAATPKITQMATNRIAINFPVNFHQTEISKRAIATAPITIADVGVIKLTKPDAD